MFPGAVHEAASCDHRLRRVPRAARPLADTITAAKEAAVPAATPLTNASTPGPRRKGRRRLGQDIGIRRDDAQRIRTGFAKSRSVRADTRVSRAVRRADADDER